MAMQSDRARERSSRFFTSFWFPLATLVLIYTLVQPWGEYPLNDDWVWSRFAKHFAETGKFVIDAPSAPTVFGQSLIAYPILRIFGFSHLALRILTMFLACVGLWAFHRLLQIGGVSPRVCVLALMLLIVNPLFMYFSTGFMTEIYSHVPALLAAALWMWDRRRHDIQSMSVKEPVPLVSVWGCGLVAVTIGFTFWIRQWTALVYPSLLISTLTLAILNRSWVRLHRTLAAFLTGAGVFSITIWLCFVWAKSTGNYSPYFATRMEALFHFDLGVWRLNSGMFPVYMTAFLFPMLLLARWNRNESAKLSLVAIVLLNVELAGIYLVMRNGMSDFDVASWTHKRFPFLSNIIYNAGIGPITLPDVYQLNRPLRPLWPGWVWDAVLLIILNLSILWSPYIVSAFRALAQRNRWQIRAELILFGGLWCFSSLAAVIQVATVNVMDRYYFPCFLGLLLVTAALVDSPFLNKTGPGEAIAPAWKSPLLRFGIAILPLFFFTVGGIHDYFRWNDARWNLFHRLEREGISPTTIQGGYEMSGWYLYDRYEAKAPPIDCIGTCGCGMGWYCLDDSYLITMNPIESYTVVDREQPSYWLASGPPILAQKRDLSAIPNR